MIITVQVLGEYMILGYLDPWGTTLVMKTFPPVGFQKPRT